MTRRISWRKEKEKEKEREKEARNTVNSVAPSPRRFNTVFINKASKKSTRLSI